MEPALIPRYPSPPLQQNIIRFEFNNKLYEIDLKIAFMARAIFAEIIQFYLKNTFNIPENYPVLTIGHSNFNETVLINILDFFTTGKVNWPQSYTSLIDLIVINKTYSMPLLAKYIDVLAREALAREEVDLTAVEEQLDFEDRLDVAYLQEDLGKLHSQLQELPKHLSDSRSEIAKFLANRQLPLAALILTKIKANKFLNPECFSTVLREYVSIASGFQVYELIRILEDTEIRRELYEFVHGSIWHTIENQIAASPIHPYG